MSSAATAWAWQQRVGKKKLLLLALADLADDRGCTRTPILTLAEMIDRDRSTVLRQLAELETDGLIERLTNRNARGEQEVSRTRLRMGSAALTPVEPESHFATPQNRKAHKHSVSTESQNATPPVEPESHFATHKDINTNSLLTSNNHLLQQPRQPSPKAQTALRSVAEAGLLELWGKWVQLGRFGLSTQEFQVVGWQHWIAQGHTEILRQEVEYIIGDGGYNHPFAGLKKRMEKQIAVQQASSATTAELSRAYGEPQCQQGEVRQAPDGKKFTVAYVEYGIVFWEEGHSPNMIRDDVAAKWPVVGVES